MLKRFFLCFFMIFRCLGGPGRPGNLLKRWGMKPPTFLDGFKAPRGRPDPENDRFSAKSKTPPLLNPSLATAELSARRSGEQRQSFVRAIWQEPGALTDWFRQGVAVLISEVAPLVSPKINGGCQRWGLAEGGFGFG